MISSGKATTTDESALRYLREIIRYDDENTVPDSKIHLGIREHQDVGTFIPEQQWAINSWDSYGETPLTVACWNNDVQAVRTLIAAKADVTQPNFEGDAPLNVACYTGDVECVRALILARCDISCSRALFSPVFDCVLGSAPGTVQVLSILLEHGASVSSRDKADEGTPLHFLTNGLQANDKLNLLLAYGADINSKDMEGRTPLLRAIWQDRSVVVKLILNRGADPARTGYDNWSTLSYLAVYGSWNNMKAFLDVPACRFPDHEIRDTRGQDALDLFKSRLCKKDMREDMKQLTKEELKTFKSLYGDVRDHQIRSIIETVRSAMDKLLRKDGLGASEALQPLFRKKLVSGNLENAETLRVIGIQIREGMWDSATESLQETAEICEGRLRIPVLMEGSPCYGPVLKTLVSGGYVEGILG